jgi:hypothetical protein
MTPVVVLAVSLLAVGCTSSNAECDCVPARMNVNIPDGLALEVTSVALSGPACTGVAPSCDRYGVAGGCVEFGFDAVAAGNCHLDVDFQSGEVFSDDVTVSQATGCCAGFYADPVSAGEIDVPGPDDARSE